jgi:hypothetical protein
MDESMKDSSIFLPLCLKEKENLLIPMGLPMRAIGGMVSFTGMVSLYGIMDQPMKGNTRMGRNRATENSYTPIKKLIRVNGWMESRKDKDHFSIRMGTF